MNRKQRRAAAKQNRAQEYSQLTTTVGSNTGDLLAAGIRHHQAGRLDEAERLYRQIPPMDPGHADSLHLLGVIAKQRGQPARAIELINKAISVNPNFPEAISDLGVVFANQGKPADAIACYHRALALKPGLAGVHSNLAIALKNIGRVEEARKHLEIAIKLSPRNPRYYLQLIDTKRFLANDPHLAAMEKLAKDSARLTSNNQIELHFAMAKAYADLTEYQQSFHHLIEGNALKRRQISYDENTELRHFERIQKAFTRELIEEKRGPGDSSPLPIFIIGMPRSGTTLVDQIISSHHQVFGPGELPDFLDALQSLPASPGTFQEFPENVLAMDASKLRQLGAHYVGRIRSRAFLAERIVDKMPTNFQFAGLIHLALPNARIIHVRRNPLDTCLSCFATLFAHGNECTYELAELGRYYKAYRKLMDHWRHVLPAGAMLEVQYEDVIDDVERQARRILNYCGLDWDPACIEFYKNERMVHTASMAQVRQPIYRTSIGRWRPYKDLLEPLIDELGPGLAQW